MTLKKVARKEMIITVKVALEEMVQEATEEMENEVLVESSEIKIENGKEKEIDKSGLMAMIEEVTEMAEKKMVGEIEIKRK